MVGGHRSETAGPVSDMSSVFHVQPKIEFSFLVFVSLFIIFQLLVLVLKAVWWLALHLPM